mgnify:CR=1 FL=1
MGAIGVDGSWKQTVSGAGSAISSIGKMETIQLSNTDLAPFKQFEKIIPQINSSLSSFKSYSQQDTKKMIRVGENKKSDDLAGSKNLMIARRV